MRSVFDRFDERSGCRRLFKNFEITFNRIVYLVWITIKPVTITLYQNKQIKN